MGTVPHVPHWRAAASLSLGVAITCVAPAACGSPAAGNDADATASPAATVSSGGGLCASAQTVQRLSVHRVNMLPQNHERFTFPARANVNDPTKIRMVAQAVCELPPMPGGAFACPADWGIKYQLTFTADGNKLPTVTIDATGCQTVQGFSRTIWVARTPGFWSVLGKAIGVPHAASGAFGGSMP